MKIQYIFNRRFLHIDLATFDHLFLSLPHPMVIPIMRFYKKWCVDIMITSRYEKYHYT